MKMGADRKRLLLLGGLALVGIYVVWTNVFSSDSSSETAPVARVSPVAAPAAASAKATMIARRVAGGARPTEWKPIIDPGAIDPLKADPTLRLDLLAKVQNVEVSGPQRNLFQFGEAPKPAEGPMPVVGRIPVGGAPHLPPSGVAVPSGPALVAAPPAITLKYYGFSNPRANANRKRAFFLDGDDIIMASEGELIKKRYRLMKIGVNSVTMEDTQFKNNQQTLPLAEDVAG